MVSLARSNTHDDCRIVIFEQSFLQSDCTDADRCRYDVFLAEHTRSNTYFVHYLNNYNFRMAFLREDGTSLEAKLVMQLEEDARKRLVERLGVEQNYSLPEVIVSLFPLPDLFDWTMEHHGPFEFEKSDMVYLGPPTCDLPLLQDVLADPRDYIPSHNSS